LYFLHNENANVTVAVMESLIPVAAPPIFEDGLPHVIFVNRPREPIMRTTKVVKIHEKVNFLGGNEAALCIVRAPNMVEKE